MKNQVRNGILKAKEVEVDTSDMVSSSGIQDLEKKIEEKKWFNKK